MWRNLDLEVVRLRSRLWKAIPEWFNPLWNNGHGSWARTGLTVAQVSSIYSQNYHPVTDAWESVPIAYHLSFCTKGMHAWSCRIYFRSRILSTWILRLRLRLRAEWQGGRHTAKSDSFRTRETNRKEIWCRVDWLGWYSVHRFWFDPVSIVFRMMLCVLALEWRFS